MFQKFYSDNLISRFIKCLLWDTYVPTVDIWRPGKAIVKGLTYVTYDKYIAVANKDFIPNSKTGPGPRVSTDKDSNGEPYFEIIEPYIPGRFYRGITSNIKSNSSLYDSLTHYGLGQYLRMVRDLYELDLMPYYNCFDGTVSDKIRVNKVTIDDLVKDKLISDNTVKDNLKVYLVPIKFNQGYTIYFNSSVPFRIKPVYYNGITVTEVKENSNNGSVQSTLIRHCSKTEPAYYSLIEGAESLVYEEASAKMLEDYLYLLVQVPSNLNSSLVVLEGDYRGVKPYLTGESIYKLPVKYLDDFKTKLENGEGEEPADYLLSEFDLNKIFKPFSSLTLTTGSTNYAFNDRLVEYLLYSPVINRDRVRDNILRVQENISSDKAEKLIGSKYRDIYIKDI